MKLWRKLLQFLRREVSSERRLPGGKALREQIQSGEKEAVRMKIEETEGVNRTTSSRLRVLEIQKDILKRQ